MNPLKEKMVKIIDVMRSHDNFVITSHLNPDGDSIGSELALAITLHKLGKRVRILNADATPANLQGLPFQENIRIGNRITGPCDVIFFIECTDEGRSGLENLPPCLRINLDHHLDNTFQCDINLIDPRRAALGELIFDLLRAGNFELSPDIVTNLYMAIITDTGSFRYGNTSPDTFAICSELLKYGIDHAAIANMAFNTFSNRKLRLMGHLLANSESRNNGKICAIALLHRIFVEWGIHTSETEGIIDYLQLLKEMQIVVFFKEFRPENFRVSLRSRGKINVAEVAKKFGGGGHINASGLNLYGSFDRVKKELYPALEKALEEHGS